MKFAEIHCHTNHSNPCFLKTESFTTPEILLSQARKRGLSAIAITDHNTISGNLRAQKLSDSYDIVVIPAEEFSTNQNGQILGYGIKPGIVPFRSPAAIIDDIHKQKGVAIVAHPFDIVRGMNNLEEVSKKADGIEVLNFGAFNNRLALKYAQKNKIRLMTGGSDAHHWSLIGSVVLGFPDFCHTQTDYVKCLRGRDFVIKTNRGYIQAMIIGGLRLLQMKLFDIVRLFSHK